jgi:hypothetical protein
VVKGLAFLREGFGWQVERLLLARKDKRFGIGNFK